MRLDTLAAGQEQGKPESGRATKTPQHAGSFFRIESLL
jgi:hypothetical protein